MTRLQQAFGLLALAVLLGIAAVGGYFFNMHPFPLTFLSCLAVGYGMMHCFAMAYLLGDDDEWAKRNEPPDA